MRNVFVRVINNTLFRLDSVNMIEDKFGLAIVHLDSGNQISTFIPTEKFHELLKSENITGTIIDASKGK